MLLAILAVQILLLIAVVLLLMRKSAPDAVPDPRQLQLPDQIARVDARAEALDAPISHAGPRHGAHVVSQFTERPHPFGRFD